jgi:cell division protein FtsW (lipid II flippase)
MAKSLDWLITGVIVALVMMAQYRLVFAGVFAPFPLAAGITLLILVRIVHQHAPKWIAAKYRRK